MLSTLKLKGGKAGADTSTTTKKRKWKQSTLDASTFSVSPKKTRKKDDIFEHHDRYSSQNNEEHSCSSQSNRDQRSYEYDERSSQNTSNEWPIQNDKSEEMELPGFSCATCNKYFTSKRSLIIHVKKHMLRYLNLDTHTTKKTEQKKKEKSKRTNNIQRFKSSWIRDYPWAGKSTIGDGWFKCTVCNKDLCHKRDGITSLKRHNTSRKHQAKFEDMKKNQGESNLLSTIQSQNDHSVISRARKLEIMIALFLAQYNLPLSLSDGLLRFIKHVAVDIDSKVQRTVSCGTTKCTAIINNVTGKYAFEKLVRTLQRKKFSLIIDESTDISCSKNLAIAVRFRGEDFTVRDRFLALLEVKDGSSEGLYTALVNFFSMHKIPYTENMVGFAADGASVMFGDKNGVAKRFQKDIPHLFMMRCICHSLALAVSNAVKALPEHLTTLLSDVFRYLKYSCKRQDILSKFQVLLELPKHKILRFHQLRWLSLNSVVDRFVEQFDVLFLYFEAESKSNIKKTAEEARRILNIMKDRYTLLYLQFLKFSLPLVCRRNQEFQAEKPKIDQLYNKMETLFKTLVGFYLDDEYVTRTEPEFLAYCDRLKTEENACYWVPLRDVDLGPVVTAELACMEEKTSRRIDEFRQNCRSFYATLADQIYLRFQFNKKEVKVMRKFDFLQNPAKYKNISDVASAFGMDIHDVNAEFKSFRRSHYVRDFNVANNTDDNIEERIVKFWKSVANDDDFPLLNELVENISILPHSSATVERLFSAINLNKTKLRNRLSSQTISGLLHSKEIGKNMYECDFNCKEMISAMNNDIYLKE